MSGNVGITAYQANKWLDEINPLWFQVHVGVPGADGTANPSANTTRVLAAFAPAANGAFAFTGIPPIWLMTTGETITHVSAWDGSGVDANCVLTGKALAARVVADTDQLALGAFTTSFVNLATD